jgi:hypothetical protein
LLTIVYSLATSTTNNKSHNDRDKQEVCENLEGLTINSTGEDFGQVTFMPNEACTSVSAGYDRKVAFTMPIDKFQNLREYFERPRLISTGTIPITRSVLSFNNVTLSNLASWFPNYLSRLLGVHGTRFTLRLTLTTASTPFQQGVLCMGFQYGQFDTNNNTNITYSRFNNSAMTTTLPHVRHDISETTMTQLDVPYLAAEEFLPHYYVDSSRSLGSFGVVALMPYRTIAGVNAPTYRLFASLHDLELIGSAPFASNTVTVQSGLTASDDEAKAFKISTALSKVSDVIRYTAKGVPMISGAAGTTSWFLESAGKVARSFGYSKPSVETEPNRVFRNAYICDGNTDVPDNSFVLGPMARNKLAASDLPGGTTVDEMSFDYILKQPSQIFVGDMSTTDAMGTVLYAGAVTPSSWWFRTNSSRPGGNITIPSSATAITNAIYPSTLCYIGSMFRYWRGGVRFTFTFCKTKLHGGRVIAAFVPGLADTIANAPLSSTVPTIEITGGVPQPSSYSQVFDLRDSSVFHLDVPYISPTLYTNFLSATGAVSLTVIDPLVTSGEMSGTVNYMVEVEALDDFSLSCPAPPMFSPLSDRTNTVTFLQSGLGGVEHSPPEVDLYTSGEVVKSVKTLLMIPSYVSYDVASNSISLTDLPPWWVRSKWVAATPMPDSSATFAYTRSGNLAACYAFCNGSTIWHLYHDGPANKITFNVKAEPTDSGTTVSGGLSDPRNRSPSGVQRVVNVENSTHVRVPSYARTARLPVNDYNSFALTWAPGTTYTTTGLRYQANVAQAVLTNISGGIVRTYFGRAAADDARLYGWIGPPPVVMFQSTNTTLPDNIGIANF